MFASIEYIYQYYAKIGRSKKEFQLQFPNYKLSKAQSE